MIEQQRFRVGDRVKAVAFVDCVGKAHAERRGLTITAGRLIEAAHGVPAYWRYVATFSDGYQYIEGAERFFEPDCEPVGYAEPEDLTFRVSSGELYDVKVELCGTVGLLVPMTPDGREWIDENLQAEPWQWYGGGLACEPCLVADICDRMGEAGLAVDKDEDESGD